MRLHVRVGDAEVLIEGDRRGSGSQLIGNAENFAWIKGIIKELTRANLEIIAQDQHGGPLPGEEVRH